MNLRVLCLILGASSFLVSCAQNIQDWVGSSVSPAPAPATCPIEEATPTPTPAAPATTYATVVKSDSPIFYWRMGETTGVRLQDSVGTQSCTLHGGYTLDQTGPLTNSSNNGILFNGTNSYAHCGWGKDILTFTVEAWIKFTNPPGGAMSVANRLTGQQNGWRHNFYLQIGAGTELNLGMHNGATWVSASGTFTGWNAGEWYHVAGSWDGTTPKLYINGVEETLTANTMAGNPIQNLPMSVIGIGGDPGQNLTSFFDGAIDEVAIYESVLSGARILEHYDSRELAE